MNSRYAQKFSPDDSFLKNGPNLRWAGILKLTIIFLVSWTLKDYQFFSFCFSKFRVIKNNYIT